MIRLIAAAGAVAGLIGFFLPWVAYQQATYSGFDLAQAIAPALEQVKAGGLKGFNLALHAVPVLSIVSLAFLGVSWLHRQTDAAGRETAWALAASVAGLAITALFVGSALLPGAPGTQFSPGLIRTDAAVKATAATTLNAGTFVALGAGVWLTLAGFALATLCAVAGLRATSGASRAESLRASWRTQDYVLLAVLAVVFGALYWWWLQ